MSYDKYKSSGTEWIGDVPTNWKNYRVDWISAFVRGNTGFKKDELLNNGEYVALQYGKTYKVDEVNNSFNFFVNSEFYKYSQIVKRGDTIFISTSETIEDLGHTCFYNREELGLVGGEQILLKPNSKLINGKYLYYYSKFFSSELKKYATGLKVFRFNTDDLKNVFIAIPSLEEQITITKYLDIKTQAIDIKVNLLAKKVDYYKELRKSIINDAVCKGLDKGVKLKESGIELIGQIPKHWKTIRFKDFTKIIQDGTHFTPNYTDNGINFLSVNDITRQPFDLSKSKYISLKEHETLIKRCKPVKGDILLSKNGTIGVPFIVDFDEDFSIYVSLCLIRLKKEAYNKFFFYALLADFMFEQYKINAKTNSVSNLHLDKLATFYTISPPISEQIAIAQYLDHKTQQIDTIVENLQKQTDLLKELRKTLINEVVAGKIKVVE